MVRPEQSPSAPQGPGILAMLRQATAARHARIDTLLQLRQPFGRAHYGQVLQGFAGFLASWEPAVAAALPAHLQPWFAAGRRLPLLQRDLAALGLPSAAAPALLPRVDTLPRALGSLYVMEGAALGGQFIAAQARRGLGLTPQTGCAYFQGCGTGTAARWRAFQALLAGELDGDTLGSAQACRAARETFDVLIAAFEVHLHDRAAA